MPTLAEEISQINLNAPDIAGSKKLQEWFAAIDAKAKSSGADLSLFKKYLAALTHPYKLSSEATQDIKAMVAQLNPDEDNVATGREIADVILSMMDERYKKIIPDDLPDSDKQQLTNFLVQAKAVTWGKECVLQNQSGELQQELSNSIPVEFRKFARDITNSSPAEIEKLYHDLWTYESFRQNILTRSLLFEEGDAQDFLRLPPGVWRELPPFIKVPSQEDLCRSFESSIRRQDPENPVLKAEGDRNKMTAAIEEAEAELKVALEKLQPKSTNDDIRIEDSSPGIPSGVPLKTNHKRQL